MPGRGYFLVAIISTMHGFLDNSVDLGRNCCC